MNSMDHHAYVIFIVKHRAAPGNSMEWVALGNALEQMRPVGTLWSRWGPWELDYTHTYNIL